jgi:hypothetical protein
MLKYLKMLFILATWTNRVTSAHTVFRYGKIALSTKANGSTTRRTAKANYGALMATSMRAIGKMTKQMASGNSLATKAESNTSVLGQTTYITDRA